MLEIAVDDTESLTVGITLEVIVEETEEEIEAAMKRMETIQVRRRRLSNFIRSAGLLCDLKFLFAFSE